ncbi:hypothetical protein BH10PSE9_BH10PSE9_05610 [soil metagenome]
MSTSIRLPETTLRQAVKTLLMEAGTGGRVKASRILNVLQRRDEHRSFTDAFLWRAMMAEARDAGIAVEIDSLPPMRMPGA